MRAKSAPPPVPATTWYRPAVICYSNIFSDTKYFFVILIELAGWFVCISFQFLFVDCRRRLALCDVRYNNNKKYVNRLGILLSFISLFEISNKYIHALLSLAELQHYCDLIGRELHCDATRERAEKVLDHCLSVLLSWWLVALSYTQHPLSSHIRAIGRLGSGVTLSSRNICCLCCQSRK